MIKLNYFHAVANYQKALSRLQKNLRTGQFKSYTQEKKQQIWNRLCRYSRQVGLQIKASVATACIAAGLSLAVPASAQTFILQSGAANPFNGVVVGTYSAPAFVDIDGDGDKDVFIGGYDGTITYYKNTGTSAAPVFALQTGAANPLDGVSVGTYSAPAFVDIDGDGDKDVFIGGYDGTITYYKNTGTSAAPVFALQTGAANPLDGVSVGNHSIPTFVDIDGDGDMDTFIGEYNGKISYYKNTGTALAPVFTVQKGAANPFNGVDVTYYSAPAFVDIDGDGDMDAFIGSNSSSGQPISYFKNTGTSSAPVFSIQSGAANPFNGETDNNYSAPAFVDIDGDGDMDAFIGEYDGTIMYYKNTTVLPLQLLGFSGSRQNGYNELEWQTVAELNTKQFEIEQSNDGRTFIKITAVNAKGNGNNNYSIRDYVLYSGKAFYRLKMVDNDARFTYSPIIWIDSRPAHVGIYPNPATNVVNINIGNAEILNTNAGIYDANGRLVKTILINSTQQPINVQSLSKGVYIIKFANSTAQSFIKE